MFDHKHFFKDGMAWHVTVTILFRKAEHVRKIWGFGVLWHDFDLFSAGFGLVAQLETLTGR